MTRARPTPPSRPVRVFVAGTFDGLHAGHLFLFRYARERGGALARQLGRRGVRLTVVIARDDSVRRIKNRAPHHTEDERRDLIAALRLVDDVFVGYRDDFIKSVRRARPDLIVLGYDQSPAWEEVLRRAHITTPVLRCPRYGSGGLKSSKIRADLEKMRT